MLNFHSFSPLARSSTLILFCHCEVYICRCECTFGAIKLADSRRFESSQRLEAHFTLVHVKTMRALTTHRNEVKAPRVTKRFEISHVKGLYIKEQMQCNRKYGQSMQFSCILPGMWIINLAAG